MTSELSQHDKDFAHAMALKLRLNREKRAAEEKEQKLIEEAGDFRMSFVRAAIEKHPTLWLQFLYLLGGVRLLVFKGMYSWEE